MRIAIVAYDISLDEFIEACKAVNLKEVRISRRGDGVLHNELVRICDEKEHTLNELVQVLSTCNEVWKGGKVDTANMDTSTEV